MVSKVAWGTDYGEGRGKVDDRTAFVLCNHEFCYLPGTEKCASDVYVHDTLELFRARIQKTFVELERSIVYEDVNGSKGLCDLCNHLENIGFGSNITVNETGLSSCFDDLI